MLCPDGVEYKTFGDIATIYRGASPRPIKNFITGSSDGINWIKIGDIKTGNKYVEKTKEKITEEGAKKSRFVKKGDFILSNSMSFGRPYILNIDGCIHDGWLSISDFENSFTSDFLYHLLSSHKLQAEMRKRASFGGAVQNLNADIVKALVLPIPPLPAQEEIVRILDCFAEFTTELNENLTAELTERKQQYEYYRDSLLNKETEKKSLKEILLSSRSGGTPLKSNKDYYENGNIPWLRTQEVVFNEIYETNCFITELAVQETSAKWIPANCVIVAISGASAGRCAINKIPVTTNQHCLSIEIDPSIAISKYVFYCVCNQYEDLIAKKEGARGDLNASRILSLEIPVPSLPEQQRIVNTLDRFVKLCNDISEDLPAEIKARKQQYEYYRDKLLTFRVKEL